MVYKQSTALYCGGGVGELMYTAYKSLITGLI